jgi:tRNA pseudouridine55 synthase
MAVRNRRPDLNGLLVIDKPLGWSSADVCRFVRRRTGGAKVGHGGTLDPLATGVLVVCLGRATKSIDGIVGAEKDYRAAIDLSAFTTTDDAEGERTEVAVDEPPATDAIRRALDEGFAGEIEQRPPAFSAVKIGGRRAYKLARAGEAVEPEPKRVVIHETRVERYDWPALDLFVRCGKGVYIRSIARDLGVALGTGGSLTGLVRTRVGAYRLADAVGPDDLPADIGPDDLRPIPPAPGAGG